MLCHTIATVQNGKIRNEAIYRSLLGSFHPVFMNIHASPPYLPRTHFSKPVHLIWNKIGETNVRPNGANHQWVRVPLQGGVGTPG